MKIEEELIYFENGRQNQIFLKMEDDLNFFLKEDTMIFFKMEDNLNKKMLPKIIKSKNNDCGSAPGNLVF